MVLKKELRERIKDVEAQSHFKPWFKRWWGKVIILLIILSIILFIYFSYLLFNNYRNLKKGNIYYEDLGTWITTEQYRENQKIVGEIMTEDDPWLGAEEPLIYIIAFESFACPFCRDNQEDLQKMITKFGKIIRFIFKDFPTEGLHENVFQAHLGAACAQEQGRFWEYHDLLFANQGDFTKNNLKYLAQNSGLNSRDFNSCLDEEKFSQEIRQDYAQGVQAGVAGTPSYLINGQLIPGAISYETWEEIIALIIKQGL